MILQMFSEEKSLSRERLCEKTGLSDATAKREIAFLKKSWIFETCRQFKGRTLDCDSKITVFCFAPRCSKM